MSTRLTRNADDYISQTREMAKAERIREGLRLMATDARCTNATIRRFIDQVPLKKGYLGLAEKIRPGLERRAALAEPGDDAYNIIRAAVGSRPESVAGWLADHEGVYVTYRSTSTGEKIQISRLEIYGRDGTARYIHRHKRAIHQIGEPEDYLIQGHIFPVREGAHFVSTATGRIRHIIMRRIKVTSHFSYMVGMLLATADTLPIPFASRLLAIRVSERKDDPFPPGVTELGLPMSEEEDEASLRLGVYPAASLKTIADMLRDDGDTGVMRAVIGTPVASFPR